MDKQYIFLGGLPKCGTSSLFQLLAEHPEICASSPKETFYFLDRGHPLLREGDNFHDAGGADAFMRHFAEGMGASWFLEGSTHLFFQNDFFDLAKQHLPETAHFLFVFREPARRILSSFEYTQNNLSRFKKPLSFEAYVEMLLKGDEAHLADYIEPGPSLYVLKRELQYSHYHQQLLRWLEAFGSERIKCIQYEAYSRSPQVVTSEILKWLGLTPLPEAASIGKSANVTTGVRFKYLHRFLSKNAALLPKGKLKQWAKMVYVRFQNKPIERSARTASALLALQNHLASDTGAFLDTTSFERSLWT